MRVAIFSDNFYPELSGISDSVIVLARELVKLGHSVDFYVPKYSKADYDVVRVSHQEIDLGERIQIFRLPSIPFPTGTGQGRFVIPTGFRAFSIFKTRPDIIHSQLFFGVGLEAMFAARVLKKPIIGTNHTALKQFLRYSPVRMSWLDLWLLKYMNWYYERCELVTAPSQSIIDQMTEIGFSMAPKKMSTRIVPNPITIPPEISSEERNTIREKYAISGPAVIYAGRFASEKKIDALLTAIAVAKKSMPDIVLVLAGSGPMRGELGELARSLGIENNVRFTGVLAKPELYKLYRSCDICCTASESEVQSITMLEAMAAGLPVVAVNVPGLAEHIDGRNGRLAEPDNPNSLSREIVNVLNDDHLLRTLSAGAKAFAVQFAGNHVAKEWQMLYQKAVHNYDQRNKKF